MASISKLLDRSSRFLQRTLRKPSWDFARFVEDPRSRHGRRWRLNPLLTALLFGLITNRRSLRGVEELTEWEGRWVRATIAGRTPDTTLYDLLSGLGPDGLREQLHAQGYALWRAKALEPIGLSCTVAAIDGKTLLSGTGDVGPDPQICQVAHPENRPAYWQLRAVRSCVISAAGCPVIDQLAIPAQTNEMGIFATVFASLEAAYGVLIEVYSMDSGYCSLENATRVAEANKGYIFVVKQNQPELFAEAERLLGGTRSPEYSTEWEPYQGKQVRYHLLRSSDMAGYLTWTHLEQVWRVDREVRVGGGPSSIERRYLLTNTHRGRLTARHTLEVVRRHWMIENSANWTTDVIWDEDTKAWCTKGHAIEVLGLLRLMAYNLVSHLRSRYLRAGDRKRPWRWWCEQVLFQVLVGEYGPESTGGRAPGI
ncbi:MAG TPA: ISAs1 family transposase [Acidimicrobiales bacterium]|nr:ISAs1 family transposase [Acidimicrobiales bacterium]